MLSGSCEVFIGSHCLRLRRGRLRSLRRLSLSTSFIWIRQPRSASLHVFSPGAFTARVNGVVTGHKADWSSFDREDVRDRLVYGEGAKGDNLIVVSVVAPKSKDAKASLPAALAAVLRIDGGDGKTLDLVTDGQWQVRKPDAEWSAAKDLGAVDRPSIGDGAGSCWAGSGAAGAGIVGCFFVQEGV